MTVKELIEILSKADLNAQVKISIDVWYDDGDGHMDNIPKYQSLDADDIEVRVDRVYINTPGDDYSS